MLQCFFVGIVLAHHTDICPRTGRMVAKLKLLPGQAKRLFNDPHKMTPDGWLEIVFNKARALSQIRKLNIGDEIGIGAKIAYASVDNQPSRKAIDPSSPLLGEHLVRLTTRSMPHA